MHTVGHHGLFDPFDRSNETRSEHTPDIDNFRVLSHTIFLVIRILTLKMPNFFVHVRQTLSIYTVGHHGLSDPFGGSNEPRSEHTPHFDDFRVL